MLRAPPAPISDSCWESPEKAPRRIKARDRTAKRARSNFRIFNAIPPLAKFYFARREYVLGKLMAFFLEDAERWKSIKHLNCQPGKKRLHHLYLMKVFFGPGS
jgi:hypothetical protein